MKRIFSLLVLIVVFACTSTTKTIVVGSKNFSEQVILGELVAQQIERSTDLVVERKLNLGGTFVCHKALTGGDIDLYVEYSGTALTAILKEEPINDPDAVWEKVKTLYEERFSLRWLEPFGFNNTFAILIRGDEARRLGIKTISEASAHTANWIAGFGYEFMERKDGFSGLAKTYGLRFRENPRVMDLTLTYRALAEKRVDLIAGDSTSGLIAKLDLFLLADDRHYFPPYHAAPVVRLETLARFPALQQALSALAGKIDERQMQEMNYKVDGEHQDVKRVVAEFLK